MYEKKQTKAKGRAETFKEPLFRRVHRKKKKRTILYIHMFSSFPTTRHSVTLEAKDVNSGGKDTRGTDFKAYGCYSWKESFYYLGKKDEDEDDESPGRRVSNTKKVAEDDDVSSPTRRTRRSDDDEKERRTISTTTTTTENASLLPVGEVSKSPRSPKDPFDEETYSMRREALFPIDEEINECLRLVTEGDAPWETPNVTAICLAANEDVVSEKQPVGTNKYRRKAGTITINEDFMEQGYNGGKTTSGKARTGDCVVTKGGNLPGVKHLVHCVVPRYVARYKTAAETALVHCYRNALSMCIEDEVASRNVGLTLLHRDEKKCYPRREGAEVLARTVRRFLEKWVHKFDSVVVLFPDEETKAYYEKEVLPIYFPRNLIELQRSREEAMDCDENGERVIVGRTISIDAFPSRHDVNSQDDYDGVEGAEMGGSRSGSMENNGAMSDDSSIGEDEDLAAAAIGKGEREGTNSARSTTPTTSQHGGKQQGRKSIDW